MRNNGKIMYPQQHAHPSNLTIFVLISAARVQHKVKKMKTKSEHNYCK
jgi:hypothetical protein